MIRLIKNIFNYLNKLFLFKLAIQEYVYLLGLIVLVVGLSLSNYLMSLGQLILSVNWVLDNKVFYKFKTFFNNKPALIFTSIFLIHVIGLIYTSDFNYALKDLRIKLPLLGLPIIFTTSGLISKKRFHLIIYTYITAVLFGTFVGVYNYINHSYIDIHEIVSPFISHIRFSLNICLVLCIIIYFIFKEKQINNLIKILMLILFCWLLYFLFILEAFTGIFILIILIISYLFYLIITNKKKVIKLAGILLFIAIPFSIYFYIHLLYNKNYDVKPIDFSKLDKTTPYGNPYQQDTLNWTVENGNHLGIYICLPELKETWNKRSKINIDSNDLQHQLLSNTLIRFLNSKGLRKDANGVNVLSNAEIKAIEGGCANVNYLSGHPISARIYKIMYEMNMYKHTGNTKGYSVIQRLELIKASLNIIKNNFWFGVGTGDMVKAYDQQLHDMHSDLYGTKLRSHNQYLSIFSALGLFGFLIFLTALFYPVILNKRISNYYFLTFFIIFLLSMLNEDTIESQAGVTFFAFFYSFFGLAPIEED